MNTKKFHMKFVLVETKFLKFLLVILSTNEKPQSLQNWPFSGFWNLKNVSNSCVNISRSEAVLIFCAIFSWPGGSGRSVWLG